VFLVVERVVVLASSAIDASLVNADVLNQTYAQWQCTYTCISKLISKSNFGVN
jgi:hypothetical protein